MSETRTPEEQEERRIVIWSTNAWVGMAPELSREGKREIFWTALRGRLPDVTEGEVAYALGIIEGMTGQRR